MDLVGHRDLQFDRSVGKQLFGGGLVLAAGLELDQFDGIGLQEAVQMTLFAPAPFEVVVAQFSRFSLTDHGIAPARKFDRKSGRLGGVEEADRAVSGDRQSQSLAGGRDRQGVSAA